MTKIFATYLQQVEPKFCSRIAHERCDDGRLYLFCRLHSINTWRKLKLTPHDCAEKLRLDYAKCLRDGDTWWRWAH